MSSPGFTRSDICSIRAIASQGRIAGTARGVLGADDTALAGDDDQHEPPARGIDRVIGLSTAAAVLAVAAIAAYVSYRHAYAVVRTRRDRYNRPAAAATIDGLVYASSMVVSRVRAVG